MPEITGRLRTPRLTTAPSSPAVGEVYYDTGTNKLYWWNGTIWVDSTGGSATYVPAEPNARTNSISSTYSAGSWNAACTFSGGGSSGDAAAYTVGSDRVTVRDAGTYTISAIINGPASTNRHLLQLSVNGSGIFNFDTGNTGNTGSGIGPSVGFTFTLTLGAGAYIQLVTLGNVAGSGAGLFSIVRNVQGQPGPKGDPGLPGTGGQVAIPFSATGNTVDRTFNAGNTTMNEIANILATLINDMKTAGLIASTPP